MGEVQDVGLTPSRLQAKASELEVSSGSVAVKPNVAVVVVEGSDG